MRFISKINNSIIKYFLYLTLLFSSLVGFDFTDLPIQDEGRIKPFDSFARNHLLAIYGKREIKKDTQTATDWILDLLLDPEAGKEKKIFNIPNPDVVSSLYLDWSVEHRYSFNEIIPGLQDQIDLIRMIDDKSSDQRTVFETQLLSLSQNAMRFEELSYLKGVKLIPPTILKPDHEWVSPFEFIVHGLPPQPHQQRILDVLQELLASRLEGNKNNVNIALENYATAINELEIEQIDLNNIKQDDILFCQELCGADIILPSKL